MDDLPAQYTLAEMLDLDAQFKVYDSFLFCPADHAHIDDEMTCEILPATEHSRREIIGICRTCTREIHVFEESSGEGRRPARMKRMKDASLIFDVSFKVLLLQQQFRRAWETLQQLRELHAVASERRWRSRQLTAWSYESWHACEVPLSGLGRPSQSQPLDSVAGPLTNSCLT